MTNPLIEGDGLPSPDLKTRLPSASPAPLSDALHRYRHGYEIEDETLLEMAGLLDGLSRKYRAELARQIEDRRMLKKELLVAELHRSYLQQEAEAVGAHIGRMFVLHRQASRELRVIRKWIDGLYPGWKRIFDEACQRAANKSART